MTSKPKEPIIEVDNTAVRDGFANIVKSHPGMKDAKITVHNSGDEFEFIMARARGVQGADSVQLYTRTGSVYVSHGSNSVLPYASTIQNGVKPAFNPTNRYGFSTEVGSDKVSDYSTTVPQSDAQKMHHEQQRALAIAVRDWAARTSENPPRGEMVVSPAEHIIRRLQTPEAFRRPLAEPK